MKYSLRTHNLEVSDLDRQQMDEKLDRLEKHIQIPFVADVSLERHTLRSAGETVTCIIRVEQGKQLFRSERSDSSLQTALDEAIDAIQKELKKAHDKNKRHGGGVQR
ncbi:MAG: ribosome-associated translation inhibitor RaiA [Candidatus Andersenbacteria bacterium]|nr:ribosome-associated translation inhibitor RaiA [Candidatus Andersenbacteria bacterium]MBI3250331.1 ribosome-associated translation inhibitor RaiA [Candidatus Andersenbacteria bacterium]